MAGYVYCLTNSAIPGLVKIGKTARDPATRAAEISASTGVPTPFEIVWSRMVPNMDRAEAEIHAALESFRLTKRREFFRCTPKEALTRARRLKSFNVQKSAKGRRKRLDRAMGITLTAVTLGIFGAAVAFDLEASTVATTTAGVGLALTMLFQSVPLIGMLRG